MRADLSPDAGFSLTEILIAIFIMALASSMMVMSLPAQRDSLADEAGLLSEVVARVSDEALASGTARGIRVEPEGFQVYRRENGRWLPVRGGRKEFGFGVRSEFRRGPIVLGESESLPQIVADATGLVSAEPFELVLQNRRERMAFSVNGAREAFDER